MGLSYVSADVIWVLLARARLSCEAGFAHGGGSDLHGPKTQATSL